MKKISILTALVLASFGSAANLNLRILETSDIHTNILNYDYYQDKFTDEYGLSKTATLIKAARAEVVNSMLFDNGDLIQGNPLGDVAAKIKPVQKGEVHPVFKAMNLLGYDAANIGNHEFNYGLPFLKIALSGAKFPYVNANVYAASGKNYFKPYTILTRLLKDSTGKNVRIKVGVLGLVPAQIMQWDKSNLEGKVTAADLVKTAQKFVPEIKAKGADIVIVIAHTGLDKNEPGDLAENAAIGISKVDGVSLLLLGHSHADFPGAFYKDFPGVDVAKGTINGKGAVMPGFWGNSLGIIDVKLEGSNGAWNVVSSQSSLRKIYDTAAKKANVDNDPAIVAAIDADHKATLEYVRGKVAALETPINSYFSQVQDDPSIQIVNQAQTWYVKRALQGTQYEKYPVLSAAAPFKAGGRAGASYYTDIPAGTLAVKNISDLYVYPNTLKAVLITGAQVKEWLERSAGQFNQIDPKGKPNQLLVNDSFPAYNFDVIDGVTYEIDVTQPNKYDGKGGMVEGANRIKNLQFEGKPIDPAAKFVVATNNYRASGGGAFPGLDGKNIILDSPDENRQAIIGYVSSLGSVNPKIDNNWKLTPIVGNSVLFLSSPNAVKYLPANAKKQADRADGFSEYILSW